MEVCVMGICGESRDMYVVFGLECRGWWRGSGGLGGLDRCRCFRW